MSGENQDQERVQDARSKKLLVYATQHMPTGGIESHLMQFCEQMTRSGIVIDLYVLNSRMAPCDEITYRKICRHVHLNSGGGTPKRVGWLIKQALRARAGDHTAMYTNGQGDSIALFGAIARRGRQWVHHHHTSGDQQDANLWPNSYRGAMRNVDKLIACSSRNADQMTKLVGRQVHTIPCYSRSISKTSDRGRPPGKIRFGYYGRLIPEKGIDHLCKLAADPDLCHIEFHIWGEGVAYPATFFTNHPSVHFHGSFSGGGGLRSALETLDGFLLLSTHPEGLPICLLESMSAGVPWIATDRGGIVDIACDPSSTRLLDPTPTYPEIKSAVLQLASDITSGLVSTDCQTELYRTKFSGEVLVREWQDALRLGNNP